MKRGDLERRLSEYRDTLRAMDTQQWVSQFADDGSVEDPVGAPAVRGHNQLRAFFEGIRKNFSLLELTPDLVIAAPPEAVVKWTTRGVTQGGTEVKFQGVTTYTFQEDGKIAQMRAFWDAADVGRQLKASAGGTRS